MQDPKAIFEILVREHTDMLESYLRSLLGHATGLDDLFQETMLVAWRRLGDYDRERPFGAWLRGIARNLVLEHGRLHARRPVATDPEVLDRVDRRFDILSRLPGDSFAERTARLRDCLTRLPEPMRDAVDLVYGRCGSIQEAATALGVEIETIKKRVQRARAHLAECLGVGEAA